MRLRLRSWLRSCPSCRLVLIACSLWMAAHAAAAPAAELRFAVPTGVAPVSLSANVLSEAERAYIATLPELRVALQAGGSPPYERINIDGSVTGIQADMLASLARAFGLRIKPVVLPDWPGVLAAARNGQADIVLTLLSTPERQRYLAFTLGTVEVPLAVLARTGAPAVPLEQARIALERDYFANDLVARRYPGARVVPVATTLEALQAVGSQRADAYLGSLLEAIEVLASQPVPGLEVQSIVRGGLGYYRFGVRQELAPLVPILNKGISNWRVDAAATMAQAAPWLASAPPGARVAPPLNLSRAEADILVARPSWRFGAVRGLALLNEVDANGRNIGIGAEYMDYVAERLGVSVELVPFDTVAEMLDALRQGRIDLTPLLSWSAERAAEFGYSNAYMEMPYVLVGPSDKALYWDLASMRGRRLALPREHPLRPELARRYPDIEIVDTGRGFEAMEAVLAGKADGAVEVKLFANLFINNEAGGRLRTLGEVREVPPGFHFATSKQAAALVPLIDRVLAEIPAVERDRLFRRWVAVDLMPPFDWRRWLPTLLVAGVATVLLGAAGVTSVRRQSTELQRRRRADEQLVDIGRTMPGVAFRYLLGSSGELVDTFYSAGTEAFFGLKPERRQTLLDMLESRLDADQVQAMRQVQAESLRTGERFAVAVPYRHPAGQALWLSVQATRSVTREGLVAWTGYVVDISQERELQRRLTQEAEQRHLMLASASHELRAPTHTLALALQQLEAAELPEAARQPLGIAQDATTTLGQLLDDVLDSARLNAGKLELRPREFDLQVFLAQLIESHQTLMAARGLAFSSELDTRLPRTLNADPLRLKQVLMNLLSNAAKYTPSGSVKLSVQWLCGADGGPQPKPQDAQASGPSEHLQFIVQDTGIGIASERLATLFQPFQKLEPLVEPATGTAPAGPASSGLGLSICLRLATLMGGAITLDSMPNQGTTVRFSIPIDTRPKDLRPLRAGGALLLCDDDAVSRLLLGEALSRLGHVVVQTDSGAQALQRWRSGGVRLLITDLNMTGLDGRELISAIRAEEAGQAERTGIVVCSGDPVPEQAAPGSLSPYDAYICKPVSLATLRGTLEMLLRPPSTEPAPAPSRPAADSTNPGAPSTTPA